MQYDYQCSSCSEIWEEKQFMADRDVPLTLPCPYCKSEGTVKRIIRVAARVSYDGAQTILQRCGSGWNDVLTGIKKASGKSNTIETR